MANLYEKEATLAHSFEKQGDAALSWLLIVCAVVIIGIAIFVRSPSIKAIVLAYVVLP